MNTAASLMYAVETQSFVVAPCGVIGQAAHEMFCDTETKRQLDEGRSIGCYSNRYLTVLDDTGATTRRTFGMSWWDDLASLETWAKSHPTHVRIFGAAMRHLSTFGETTRLRLFHEVSVVPTDAQWFEYLDCREGTGLLAAAAGAR